MPKAMSFFILLITIPLIISCTQLNWEILSERDRQLPIKKFYVIFDENVTGEFFESLEDFSLDNGFSHTVVDYGEKDEMYLVEMKHEEMKIVAIKTSPFQENNFEFVILFYP